MSSPSIIRRHSENPIVTRDTFPIPLEGAYNSGCIKLPGGRYVMAARCNKLDQRTLIWLLDSEDGVHFTPRPKPMPLPAEPWWEFYASDVAYDPRMTVMEEGGEILMTMACHGAVGCRIAIFRSEDETQSWRFLGYMGPPDHRNTVFFPRKFDGLYTVLDRPNMPAAGAENGGGMGGIWIRQSPDLKFWSAVDRIIGPERFRNYGVHGIGPGPPPLLTDRGWLCIIHCVMPAARTLVYSVGAIVLDRDDPTRVIGQTREAIMVPDALYEMVGLVPGVCFPCGAVLEESGEVKIYYGGADRVTALGISSVDQLLGACGVS